MLTSVRSEYAEQTRITAAAVIEADRLASRGPVFVARSVQAYQAEAVALSLSTLTAILAEQGIDATQEAVVVPVSLLTPAADLARLLVATDSPAALARLVQTLVADARRTTRAVDAATRSAVTGYVRRITLPCCGRCAILAGRVYRYSEGFRRHPRCDCDPLPVDRANGVELVSDPMEAFERGRIRGLSQADIAAVAAGADLAQVVNVRRRAAGLTIGGSVMVRAGRLTPQACLNFASSRAEALELLRRFGYLN